MGQVENRILTKDFFNNYLEKDSRNEHWDLQIFSNPSAKYIRNKFETELEVINKFSL